MLGPMPFTLAQELKFEHNSEPAKNGIDMQFLSHKIPFKISVAPFHIVNKVTEITSACHNGLNISLIRIKPMMVPAFLSTLFEM